MGACRHFLKVSQSFSSCQSLYEVVHMVDEVFEENLWTFFVGLRKEGSEQLSVRLVDSKQVGGMNLKEVDRSVKNLLETGIFLKLSKKGAASVFLAAPTHEYAHIP